MEDNFENVTNLHSRLALLYAEHKDLNEALASLDARPSYDELLIRRLNKRKLLIRCRISLIERMIMPSGRA
ncbi:MAG: DUF465 domain-containing protein [Betaproteobacteria bacterium]|nr:DUF465 domain-containing protein [Betaproteobacteria bacterium]